MILECDGRVCRCGKGHSFDRARSGYVNLLQPQDSRSRTPGDPVEAVRARRRLADEGLGSELSDHLADLLEPIIQDSGCTILDVGCGEGSHLTRLSARLGCDAAGLDLSVPAIDLAARRSPDVMWVVANADRFLPFPDGSFEVLLSITSRRNASEFSRVLAPGGRAIVVVPGPSDLIELREAVLGEGITRSRVEGVVEDLGAGFDLEQSVRSVQRQMLSRETLVDILRATYRGARRRQLERIESLGDMPVTFESDVLMFRKKVAR